MTLFGLPYVIRNRVVEFEADRRIAWRHFTANRWRYELTPTPDRGTMVTESFDTSRANELTDTGQTFTVRMKLFGVPYVIRNRVVEFEAGRRIAWRHVTANRWRYELAPTAEGGTTVTETFDTSRADRVTDALVRAAKFPERNRAGILGTLQRLKEAAEKDAARA